jgi:site-specific DNA recombinase
MRAAAYLRVSTGRQAESDLSIPDQLRQLKNFAEARSWSLVAEFSDPGASGMEEDRDQFQRMVERATDDDKPFDVIIVHSFSRFFRDAFGLEMYVRKLAKAGVRLISITQELGEDPGQVMMRQVIALFDEYQSRENAKHVLRAMKENARQGFYNGSPTPLGYSAKEVERRGARIKKQLVIDDAEAETVRLMFRLYRLGNGTSGPMGLKAIATWLNQNGYRTRRGGQFGVAATHDILTNPVYAGHWVFNRRCSRTRKQKPAKEHVIVDVPAIIDELEFEAVQKLMRSRDPRVSAPRAITGPILLTGLAVCASCDGAMTLRTGTSKSGVVHRYYACSTCNRKGKTACKGRSMPMAKLDKLVTDHLVERLFQPSRLAEMLAALAERRSTRLQQVDDRVGKLRAELLAAETKLKRLYALVEDGSADVDDILSERIKELKQDRERTKTTLERLEAQRRAPNSFDPATLEHFGNLMRERITVGEVPFRKAYIQSVVDRIEVDDNEIRIIGSKATLEQVIASRENALQGVRRCVPKWRTRHDSNV